jgi:hypothetical protein
MKLIQSAAAVGAVTAALMSGQAFAVVSTFDLWAGLTAGNIGTVTDPDDFGGLTEGDKTITFISAGVGTATQGTAIDGSTQTVDTDFVEADSAIRVTFTQSVTTGRHRVNVTENGGNSIDLSSVSAGDVLGYQYVINIDPSDYPAAPDQEVFGGVFLGLQANGTFGSFTVSKRVQGLTPIGVTGGTPWSVNNNFAVGTIFDATLSTTGATDDEVFCGVCTTFLVTDLITINSTPITADLSGIDNSFEQVVPVPAPLALVGAGILALGFSRRFGKKTA